jgi:uncharacterized membrane protein YcjF (UPF0283 family)
METLRSSFSTADWIVLGILTLVPILMALGIMAIRRELHATAQVEARTVRLKTTGDQRQRWRQRTQSQHLVDLLDDIDSLLKQIAPDEEKARQDHKEAVRLSWMSRHIPVSTLLIGAMVLISVLSAVFMVVAQGPVNAIP